MIRERKIQGLKDVGG